MAIKLTDEMVKVAAGECACSLSAVARLLGFEKKISGHLIKLIRQGCPSIDDILKVNRLFMDANIASFPPRESRHITETPYRKGSIYSIIFMEASGFMTRDDFTGVP
jgi:hypothetical protein